MFQLEIPGFGEVQLEYLVSDYTGTLSFDGRLLPGLAEKIKRVSEILEIHILTADTFGMAREQLEGLPVKVKVLEGPRHDLQKQEYVRKLGPDKVIALGNGMNDRFMLKEARIGVGILLGEGIAAEALQNADILVLSPLDAFDLLLNPKRLKATLRY